MAGIEQGSLLTVGVEAHQVHACLVESVGPAYRLAGWSTVQNDEFFIVGQQVSRACRQLGERLGRVLWDDDQDTPVYQSQDAVRYPPLQYVSAAATSRPRLRVWLAGLSSTISMAAARQALRSSPIQIVGTTHLEADLDGSDLADELIDGQPDVMVIVGGYDTSTAAIQEPLITLCRVIGLALQRMPPGQHPTIFYAGNTRPVAPSGHCPCHDPLPLATLPADVRFHQARRLDHQPRPDHFDGLELCPACPELANLSESAGITWPVL